MTKERMLLLFLAAGMLAGCSAETDSHTNQEAGEASGTSSEILYQDDFSDPASGWTQRETDFWGAGYQDGRYKLWVDNGRRQYVAAHGNSSSQFSDVRIEVEVEKLSGPAGSPIGLRCRQADEGLYFADIEEEGEARIGRYDSDGQEILSKGESPGLWRQGVNQLGLDCIGNRLVFRVNGQLLLEASDDRLVSGAVAVAAGGSGRGRTEAAFDNLVVYKP